LTTEHAGGIGAVVEGVMARFPHLRVSVSADRNPFPGQPPTPKSEFLSTDDEAKK